VVIKVHNTKSLPVAVRRRLPMMLVVVLAVAMLVLVVVVVMVVLVGLRWLQYISQVPLHLILNKLVIDI
jgi:hypothetical protein